MNEIIHDLFYYLEKEGIYISKSEFEFQLQSHPDYPTLLCLSDTFSFFNIDNAIIRSSFNDISDLPDRFSVFLKDNRGELSLFIIEKVKEKFFIVSPNKKKEISISDLKQKWGNIVILISSNTTNTNKKKYTNFIISAIYLILAFFLFLNIKLEIYSKLFIFFPIVGITLSILALKDLFGVKNNIINKFCNISLSSNCSDVVNSSKWSFFKFINFSDLSITFFFAQIISYIVFIFLNQSNIFFASQKIIIFLSYFLIFVSIYYQKNIEKKWCPICLTISLTLILESIYLQLISPEINLHLLNTLIIFILIFIFLYFNWKSLKKMLSNIKDLKEFKIKSLRFQRKYEIFKKILISEKKFNLPITPLKLGNEESKIKITIISSPYCGYCGEAHEILNKVLEKNNQNIEIQIIFKVDFLAEKEESKNVFRTFINIYLKKGAKEFNEALTNWYEIKNIDKWLNLYNINDIKTNVDKIIIQSHEWCTQNNFNFTPTIFINGYEYPKVYDREELKYFIDDLIDDPNFN